MMNPSVKIVEVGPRDGLQNDARNVPTDIKLALIQRLTATGLRHIEVTSFVSARWVPQMSDHLEIARRIPRVDGVTYSALTPNLKGLLQVFDSRIQEVAVFGAASEAFSHRNINCSIRESIERFTPVVAMALERGLRVRGYVSCVNGCPYEGQVAPGRVACVAAMLHRMGCHEISLGDTIGVGTPASTLRMLSAVSEVVPVSALAGHFHDTRGTACDNIRAAYGFGLRTFDTSINGLGGCPYAKGASGNVATERVVAMFHEMGVETGVDLDRLLSCADWIAGELERLPGRSLIQPPDREMA